VTATIDHGCPTRELLQRLSDKWSPLVLLVLEAQGVRRFGELRRAIPGVSPKMLTQTLRALEQDGLVRREMRAVSPPHVEYELTPLGRSLVTALHALTAWAEGHWDEVRTARDAFATEPPPWLVPREPVTA
jgi:DNA-binding HxlR family transcriptional regulator